MEWQCIGKERGRRPSCKETWRPLVELEMKEDGVSANDKISKRQATQLGFPGRPY